ncbi:hypothetical protein N658DRAFT_98515 [Parathielavia hyrcaniae]|uniref:Uncharacterized protein n=1 Tax=Parathielavia hyrcaniae TaxID=113614 RepID=A0AAN6T0G3_9PEZI|nr:hypothetical protein N658DRAFT_98515 [Parathielavia hyrcaniae]
MDMDTVTGSSCPSLVLRTSRLSLISSHSISTVSRKTNNSHTRVIHKTLRRQSRRRTMRCMGRGGARLIRSLLPPILGVRSRPFEGLNLPSLIASLAFWILDCEWEHSTRYAIARHGGFSNGHRDSFLVASAFLSTKTQWTSQIGHHYVLN